MACLLIEGVVVVDRGVVVVDKAIIIAGLSLSITAVTATPNFSFSVTHKHHLPTRFYFGASIPPIQEE